MDYELDAGCCPVCGCDLPPRGARGPRRTYCSNRCRTAASRERRSSLPPEPAPGESPDAEIVEAFLVGKAASADDQVFAAVHETLLLVVAYRRLGSEARRQFAWRCAGMADALDAALKRYFREASP